MLNPNDGGVNQDSARKLALGLTLSSNADESSSNIVAHDIGQAHVVEDLYQSLKAMALHGNHTTTPLTSPAHTTPAQMSPNGVTMLTPETNLKISPAGALPPSTSLANLMVAVQSLQSNHQSPQDTSCLSGLSIGSATPYIHQHQLQQILQQQASASQASSQLVQPVVITSNTAPPPPPPPPPRPQFQQPNMIQIPPQAGISFNPTNQVQQYTDPHNPTQLLLPALPVNLQPRQLQQQPQFIQVSNQTGPAMLITSAPQQQPMHVQQTPQQYMQVTQGNQTVLIPVATQSQQQQQQGQPMYALLPGSSTPQLVMVETVPSQQQEPQFLYDASGMTVQLPSAQLSQQQYGIAQVGQQQFTNAVNEPGLVVENMDTGALLRVIQAQQQLLEAAGVTGRSSGNHGSMSQPSYAVPLGTPPPPPPPPPPPMGSRRPSTTNQLGGPAPQPPPPPPPPPPPRQCGVVPSAPSAAPGSRNGISSSQLASVLTSLGSAGLFNGELAMLKQQQMLQQRDIEVDSASGSRRYSTGDPQNIVMMRSHAEDAYQPMGRASMPGDILLERVPEGDVVMRQSHRALSDGQKGSMQVHMYPQAASLHPAPLPPPPPPPPPPPTHPRHSPQHAALLTAAATAQPPRHPVMGATSSANSRWSSPDGLGEMLIHALDAPPPPPPRTTSQRSSPGGASSILSLAQAYSPALGTQQAEGAPLPPTNSSGRRMLLSLSSVSSPTNKACSVVSSDAPDNSRHHSRSNSSQDVSSAPLSVLSSSSLTIPEEKQQEQAVLSNNLHGSRQVVLSNNLHGSRQVVLSNNLHGSRQVVPELGKCLVIIGEEMKEQVEKGQDPENVKQKEGGALEQQGALIMDNQEPPLEEFDTVVTEENTGQLSCAHHSGTHSEEQLKQEEEGGEVVLETSQVSELTSFPSAALRALEAQPTGAASPREAVFSKILGRVI